MQWFAPHHVCICSRKLFVPSDSQSSTTCSVLDMSAQCMQKKKHTRAHTYTRTCTNRSQVSQTWSLGIYIYLYISPLNVVASDFACCVRQLTRMPLAGVLTEVSIGRSFGALLGRPALVVAITDQIRSSHTCRHCSNTASIK